MRQLIRLYTMHFPLRKGKGYLVHRLVRHHVAVPGEVVESVVGSGYLMDLDLSDFVQRCIYFFGYYEEGLARWLLAHLRPTDVFCDVGAHVGQYTLLAAKAVQPDGRVYAFEPEARNRRALMRNIELNRLTNVRVFPSAVADSMGVRTFFVHSAEDTAKTNWGVHSLRPEVSDFSSREETVSAVTLDSVLREEGVFGRRIKGTSNERADVAGSSDPAGARLVIKIDVQGAELLVLRGAQQALRTPGCVVLFEAEERHASRFGYGTVELKRYVASLGYQLYKVQMAGRRLRLMQVDVEAREEGDMIVGLTCAEDRGDELG